MTKPFACGFALCAIGTLAVQGDFLRVRSDASPGGDGSSWAQAFDDLQLAIGAAASGEEIWVARGVYQPTSGVDRTISFTLKEGVAIYGGFAGIEEQRDQRNDDPASNGTVLSGDIDGNDINTDGNFIAEQHTHIQGLNSFHVVSSSAGGATANAVLDGFTITGGQADGSGENGLGGGLYCLRSRVILANLVLAGNRATFGGGLNCAFMDLVLSRSVVQGNHATSQGGGIYSIESDGTMTQVILAGNSAAMEGGGLYFDEGDVLLAQIICSGNAAGTTGGGMQVPDGHPMIVHSVFAGNSAGLFGAAIGGFGVRLDNSIVWANSPVHPIDATSYQANDCVIEGGSLIGMNILTDDPRFVRRPNPAQNDFGDLRLLLGSPAIDAGNNASVPMDVTDLDGDGQVAEPLPMDMAGRARILNGTVDMGAYEGGYTTFAQAHPGLAPDGDANANGFSNIGEYAFASDPIVPGAMPNHLVLKRADDGLVLEFTRRANAADLDFVLARSDNLELWVMAKAGVEYETISAELSGQHADTLAVVLRIFHDASRQFWRVEAHPR